MLSTSYYLFITNNYSQRILCSNKNFWALWWHGTQRLSNSGLYDHLALLPYIQCTSSMGFQAVKFQKIMRSNKSAAYFGRHLHMKSYKYHLIMQEDKRDAVHLYRHHSWSLDNDQLDAHLFILQYVYYIPLHVSSITYSSSGG